MTLPFPIFLPAGNAVAPITSITQPTSATSTSGTITWPTVQAGDIAVMADFASGLGVPTTVVPDGFTNACVQDNGASAKWMVSYKVCDGTESGSLTGMSSIVHRKILAIFRPDVPAASAVHGGEQHGTATNANPTAITVAASSGGAPLIIIGTYSSSGAINPRTFTVGGVGAKDGEIANGTVQYLAWKVYISSPSDVDVDMDDEGNANIVQGFYLEVSSG